MIVHVVLDGVADGSLGVGLDVIAAARRLAEANAVAPMPRARDLAQRVVSVDGGRVRSGAGRTVLVDAPLRLRDLRAGDVLVLPGLSAVSEAAIAALLARPDVTRLVALLRRARAKQVRIAASCSATFVLGLAGLLDEAEATTTWWLANAFQRRFPAVALTRDRMVVESDGVLTAGSAFAHADLVLTVLARICGSATAHLVARYLVLDARPSQARYMIVEHMRSADPSVRAVERFVAQNLARRITLAELARVAKTSPRTLARRVHDTLGMTPTELVHRMRMAHASHLLETTRRSIEQIAADVGYADAAAFRRIFRRYMGERPGAVRS